MIKRSILKVALIGTVASCVYGFRADLIKSLVNNNHKVYAFAIDYDAVSREKVRALGAIPVDYKFSRSGLNPFDDIINTFRLYRILKKIAPNVVFSYFAKPVIFGTIAAVFAGVRHRIGMLEGLGYLFTDQPEGISHKTRIIRSINVLLYKISLRFLDRIVFLNPDDPIDLLQRNNIRVNAISVIGGIGLDLASYPYTVPPISPITFIFIGRLLAEKGINEYVAAARIVKGKYPAARFVILGGVDEENPGGLSSSQLQYLINDELVIYPGYVSNVQEWIENSSVFVLPSYREGVPRSTQEAMAMGRAVITTDVPGCRETVVHGKNGFLVPPWSPELLAEKMILFMECPSLVESMGLESYKIAQVKFDAVKINQELLSFF